MQKTKIPWTDYSWNPVVGCSKISEGCLHCYAEKMAHRLKNICLATNKNPQYLSKTDSDGHWTGEVECCNWLLEQPLHIHKPLQIFVCSMSDLFHEKVSVEYIDKVFAIMALSPQHQFQILTKRPEKMNKYINCPKGGREPKSVSSTRNLMSNVHLGVSVENQKHIDRIETLCRIPAAKRFVSFEPLIGEIDAKLDYSHKDCTGEPIPKSIDQIIIGCESGTNRRPCRIEWIRSLVNQAKSVGIKVFVKQLEINGKVSRNPTEWPEDLRLQESRNG